MRTLRKKNRSTVAAAAIETLEQRRLLTAIVVNFTSASETAFMRYNSKDDGIYFDDGAGNGYLLSTSDNITWTVTGTMAGVANDIFPVSGSSMTVAMGGSADTLTIDSAVPTSLPLTLNGGPSNDHIIGGGGSEVINGGDGDDTVEGGSGNDTIQGGANNDFLYGGTGNDTIDGDDGNDTLIGHTGNDSLYGDTGTDTASYESRTAGVRVTFDGTANDGDIASSEADNVNASVEIILGGTGNDILDGSAATVSVSLYGNDGNDSIVGGSMADQLFGGNGLDTVEGGSGNDTILGDADDDFLYGGTGVDSILGGTGNDTLNGFTGDDTLDGGSGNDSMLGGSGQDTFIVLDGSKDTIDGGAGDGINDILSGGSDASDVFVNWP